MAPGSFGQLCGFNSFGGEIEFTDGRCLVAVVVQCFSIKHSVRPQDGVGGWVGGADLNITWEINTGALWYHDVCYNIMKGTVNAGGSKCVCL